MVFHCRCFSFEDEEEIGYETRTQTKSTTTFYTAASDFNRSVPDSHTKSSEISNRVEKPSNLRVFTLAELKAATGNFCRASKIGEGGLVSVYKGVIKNHPFNEIQVAVKFPLLSMTLEEWEPEIKAVGMVKHPNLVKLIGYYVEDNGNVFGMQLLLVYEYMVNGSVRDHLSSKSETPLSWNARLKVARDVAHGLTYLHEEMTIEVILKDFNPSSILLDGQMNAKLTDFGLARLRPQQQYTSSSFVGTMAYAAPEYISTGRHTSKSDVWSYGVFLNELITGRRPLDKNLLGKLLERVKRYLGSKRFQQIIDPRLEGNYPLKSAQKLSHIADFCLRKDPNSRPKMSEVVEMINQLIEVPS